MVEEIKITLKEKQLKIKYNNRNSRNQQRLLHKMFIVPGMIQIRINNIF